MRRAYQQAWNRLLCNKEDDNHGKLVNEHVQREIFNIISTEGFESALLNIKSKISPGSCEINLELIKHGGRLSKL
jgi:hypothetical protein